MRESADSPSIETDEVLERLVAAIQDGHLRQTLADLSSASPHLTDSARTRVAEAVRAVAAIDAAVAAERVRLTERLVARGVAPSSPSLEPQRRPLHVVSFETAPRDVTRATETLEMSGYRRLAPTVPAAWRAYRATRGRCTFVRLDRDPFRVELTWSLRPLAARGALGRLLTPQMSDFEAVALPDSLWPAYTLLRLLRLPARRLRQHREAPDLGPFLQTPSALIEPLLRFAGVSARDLLVDLGCGDGRIAIAASRLFGCRARGFETNADLVSRARAAAADAQVSDKVEIVRADATRASLADADVVVAFLPVTTIERLLPTVLARMKTGARFVAHEQERMQTHPADVRMPLISVDGISVAHRWNR